jgi:hypothetical protein
MESDTTPTKTMREQYGTWYVISHYRIKKIRKKYLIGT